MNYMEKARQLYNFFYTNATHPFSVQARKESAKMYTIKVADEFIERYSSYKGMFDQEFIDAELKYWQNVKNELESNKY